MNVLDELKRKDEEARALLSAEVGAVTVKIDELTTYRNSLYAEMKRRGYALDSTLISTSNEPSSTSDVPVKPGIVHVSKDEPSLPERILDLLSDGAPRSLDEVFIAISGKPGLKRSTVANRLHEMKMHRRVATMPNDREGAQPGSYLYATPNGAIVVPKHAKPQKKESIVAAIRRVANDGTPRTVRELFNLVVPDRPWLAFDSFRACISQAMLRSMPSDRPGARRDERLFWLPKDESASPSTDLVQAPIEEGNYPVDKLIWRLMSDGKPRTKVEIYEYVVRFNKSATAATIARQIIRAGLASEMNGTDRVYRSRIANDPVNSK